MLPFGGKVSVCAKTELNNFANSRITHILSIEDPGIPKTTPNWFRGVHHQIQFRDVESLKEAKMYQATAPTKEHVAAILHFGQKCLDSHALRPPHLLVHCAAGASRSPAAAFAIITQYLGSGKAVESLDYVLRIRPQAFPNKLVVKFADELLDLNGEMLRALAPLRIELDKLVDDFIANKNKPKQ